MSLRLPLRQIRRPPAVLRTPQHLPIHHQHTTRRLPPSIRSISSIQRHLVRPPRRTSRYNLPSKTGLPALTSGVDGALQRKLAANTLPLRTGVIAIKRGMTGLYDPATGRRTPCTVLQLDRVQVVGLKTRQVHGYNAVIVGHGWRKPRNVGKPMLGVYASAGTVGHRLLHRATTAAEGQEAVEQGDIPGVSPKKALREFRVRDESGLLEVGTMVTPAWFQEGQFVDAKSNTRGKGFAGVMKRHGFHGQDASHGVSLTHRSLGSAGPSQGGGSRVHPGKKMAGRMGGQQHTVQNLKVLKVDEENGFLVVNGCLSGPKGCLVKIQDAVKKPWPDVSVAPLSVLDAPAGSVEDSVSAA